MQPDAKPQSYKRPYVGAHLPQIEYRVIALVRNKRLEGRDSFPGERVVLFVHGATYPSETVFDIAFQRRDYF
jgi:hypothetical protein